MFCFVSNFGIQSVCTCMDCVDLRIEICGMWMCDATFIRKPATILVFKIFYEVFGGGTHLAMPKTICAPDSSSLKPSSGVTEGVLD